MEEICANIVEEFQSERLGDLSNSFSLDHAPLIPSKIKDHELRNTDVRME